MMCCLSLFGQSHQAKNHSFYFSGDLGFHPFIGLDYAIHYGYKNILVEGGYTMSSRTASNKPDDYEGPSIALFGGFDRPKDKLSGPELLAGYLFRLSENGKNNLSFKAGIIFSKITTPYSYTPWQSSALIFPNYSFVERHHYTNGLISRVDYQYLHNDILGASVGLKHYYLPNQDQIMSQFLSLEWRLFLGILNFHKEKK